MVVKFKVLDIVAHMAAPIGLAIVVILLVQTAMVD
jgi:hypothetical protein